MRSVRATLALNLILIAAAPGRAAEVDDVVVRRLIAALKDSDPEVRQNLGAALARIGPSTIEPLVEALKDTSPERRAGAAYALGLIGPAARAALPGLLDVLADKEVDVRRQASFAISRLIPSPRPVPPAGITPPPSLRGGLP